MKGHSLLVIITLVLSLVLCGCGNNDDGPQTAPPVETAQAAAAEPVEETSDDTVRELDISALAESMEGKPLRELIDLIGEPSASDYAPSCLGPGEDGEHRYDGFIVYTYREGDEERIEEIRILK